MNGTLQTVIPFKGTLEQRMARLEALVYLLLIVLGTHIGGL